MPGDQGHGLEQVLLEPSKYKQNLCTAVEDKPKFCMQSLQFSPSFQLMYTQLQKHTPTSTRLDAHRQQNKWCLLTQSHVHRDIFKDTSKCFDVCGTVEDGIDTLSPRPFTYFFSLYLQCHHSFLCFNSHLFRFFSVQHVFVCAKVCHWVLLQGRGKSLSFSKNTPRTNVSHLCTVQHSLSSITGAPH